MCVRFIFPLLPGVRLRVDLGRAFVVTFVSAFVIGIVGLELGGGMVVIPFLEHFGFSNKLAFVLVKNTYLTLSPFFSGFALLIWTTLMPSLGFYRLAEYPSWDDEKGFDLLQRTLTHHWSRRRGSCCVCPRGCLPVARCLRPRLVD